MQTVKREKLQVCLFVYHSVIPPIKIIFKSRFQTFGQKKTQKFSICPIFRLEWPPLLIVGECNTVDLATLLFAKTCLRLLGWKLEDSYRSKRYFENQIIFQKITRNYFLQNFKISTKQNKNSCGSVSWYDLRGWWLVWR